MKIKYILYLILLGILLYYGIGYFTTTKHKGGNFVLAHDRTFHPLDLLGKEVEIEIFCDHLIEQIAKDQDIGITIETVSYEHLQSGLQSHVYDGILVPVLEEWGNIGSYYFSEPLFSLGPVLVIRIDDTEKEFQDFKGKTIGVVRSSPLMSQLNAIPSISVSPYDKLFDAMEALINNRIDGLVMDGLQAYVYTQGFFKEKLKIFQPALNDAGIQIVTLRSSKNRSFIDSFNEGLFNLFKNGQYEALMEYWGFKNYPRPPIKEAHPLSLEKAG